MFKFVGKALAGMVLTKEAQEAVGQIAKSKLPPFLLAPQPTPEELQAALTAQAPETAPIDAVKTNREELIRNAMSIRAEKQELLASLDPESRAKLAAIAMKALLNEGPLKG